MHNVIEEYGEIIVGIVIGVPLVGIAISSLIIVTINI